MLQPVRLVSSEHVLADSRERPAQHAWGLDNVTAASLERLCTAAVPSRVVDLTG